MVLLDGDDGKEITMPRGRKIARRRPTTQDLTPQQIRIYEALPSEIREDYMATLPDVLPEASGATKKKELIQKRLVTLSRMQRAVSEQMAHLNDLIKQIDNGQSTASIDLRRELAPPDIEGVIMRFERGPRKPKDSGEAGESETGNGEFGENGSDAPETPEESPEGEEPALDTETPEVVYERDPDAFQAEGEEGIEEEAPESEEGNEGVKPRRRRTRKS